MRIKLHHKIRIGHILLLLFALQIIGFFYLIQYNDFNWYYNQWFQWKSKIQSQIFGVFSFSVGDLLYILLGLWILQFIIKNIRSAFHKDWDVLKKSGTTLLIFINLSYFIYQVFWGLNYHHSYFEKKYHQEEISKSELIDLANQFVVICKRQRALSHEDEDGVFTLQLNQNEVIKEFNPVNTVNVKPSLFGNLVNYAGVLGYFNPFTGEAQYNAYVPKTKIPYTVGHEMAHQSGVSRENEANFLSYIQGIKSNEPEILYSSYYMALRSLLRAILKTDPDFVKSFIETNYSDAMKRDREREHEHFYRYNVFSRKLFRSANDTFLKANRQKGIESYSQFVNLLVGYEKSKES